MGNAIAMGKGDLGSVMGTRNRPLLRTVLALCIAASLLQACATKGETMAGLGAIAGAVIGKAVGGDTGAVIGAAIGASIGYDIGKDMDEADRKKLADARARAIQENTKQQFYSPSVKAQVTVEPGKPYASPQKQALLFDKDTQVVPMTVAVTEAQAAYVDTPIYQSPDYNHAPKLLVTKGASMRRIAAVDGTDWYVVGQGEYGIGYVHKDYFDRKIVAATERAAALEKQAKAAAEKKPEKLDSSTAQVKPPATKPAKPAKVESGPQRSLLDSTALNLPPASHFSAPKANRTEFAATASAGANRADAVKQGNKFYLLQAKQGFASTQCRDLVTTLLQENKTATSEKTSSCSSSKGWL